MIGTSLVAPTRPRCGSFPAWFLCLLVAAGSIGCSSAPSVGDVRGFLAKARTPTEGSLVVTFFPTGIGDAILVEFPNGSTMLVDAGVGWKAHQITRYVAARQIEKIDVAVVTHPHLDHFGGIEKVLEDVRVDRLFDNGIITKSFRLDDMDAAVDALAIPRSALTRGDVLTDLFGGEVHVDTLLPDEERRDAARKPLGDENRGSIVLRLVHGSHRILLTGDAEHGEEDKLVELEGEALRAHVLKLGHHASIGSSKAEFLAEVRPQLAIAQGTEVFDIPLFYPRPCYFVMKRLREVGAQIVEPDNVGIVQVVSDENGLRWTSWKSAGSWETIVDPESSQPTIVSSAVHAAR